MQGKIYQPFGWHGLGPPLTMPPIGSTD